MVATSGSASSARSEREDAQAVALVGRGRVDDAGFNVGAAQLVAGLGALAELDKLCTTSYAGIVFNDRLAFQLAIDPVKVCATAAHRQEHAVALVPRPAM